MSIRTNPMKAVPLLLKRVKTARSKFMEKERDESFDGQLEKLTWELRRIENVFMKVKKNQDELVDNLHEIDAHLRKLDKKRLDQDMDVICKRIRDSAHKLVPMDSFDDIDDISSQILHSSHPSSTQPNNQVQLPQPQHINLNRVRLTFEETCLLGLSIFPENAVIRKRQAIYLWIGLDFIYSTREQTAEEYGENMIDQLLELNAIVPYGNGQCPIVNKFKLNPHIRPQSESLWSRQNAEHLGYFFGMPYRGTSLVLKQQKVKLGVGHEVEYNNTVYNISASYLNFESKWMDKFRHLEVLHLGRWQDSPSHHIEVGSQEFLKDLSHLKIMRYLSLRGISRIFELPPSIARLDRLEILDLKACHNLETLPDDISSMASLTHLILSECYMLDGMPKGIDKLAELQVLKGFVIGNSIKTTCTIVDLANLKHLRRLSIHIGKEAVIKDMEFQSLREMSSLEHLKISWDVSDTNYSYIQITLPSNLKKLHLQGFRGQIIPGWLKPSKLPGGLKELNITGGKLANMNHDEDNNQWDMEIVHLKYLKHLKIDITNLQMLFPKLKYALIKPIPYHSYIEWSSW